MPNTLTEAICALICVEPNTHAAHTHTHHLNHFSSRSHMRVCVCVPCIWRDRVRELLQNGISPTVRKKAED